MALDATIKINAAINPVINTITPVIKGLPVLLLKAALVEACTGINAPVIKASTIKTKLLFIDPI
jgi:hypothetical protein